ncbi:MAG: 4-hydroxyphenylpyruvate dioxygenase [Phycisphaerales bacterium]|nr:4-hydroxyphenylpyruvate dioxygenase [Phycisphaerales bacterium]MCB9857652.1 4-hydroxyphenylpyruvate dioxygenase [Phycisphaerales bacterium]
MTQATSAKAPAAAQDFLPLDGIDHIEFYVGNALQAAQYYRHLFGFDIVARRGLETGDREKASYVLEQGKVRFVLTSALSPDHEVARFCNLHGDGVKAVAFRVKDVDKSIAETRKRGATVVQQPTTLKDERGEVRIASIRTYGEVIHRFVSREGYKGEFVPGFEPMSMKALKPTGLASVDHIVGNVELGAMNHWASYYANVLGFQQLLHFTDDDISTEYSALMSKVMQNGTGKIKFPLNEPAEGKKKSQIEEYLDFNYGPGVQHIAMTTGDICETVRTLRDRGVRFLRVPDTYYDALSERVGKIDEDMATIRELGILVDRDEDGYLLQIFTQPLEDRPTLFFEVIERHGSRGFGVGNFKALFVSIEEEQRRRGTL